MVVLNTELYDKILPRSDTMIQNYLEVDPCSSIRDCRSDFPLSMLHFRDLLSTTEKSLYLEKKMMVGFMQIETIGNCKF